MSGDEKILALRMERQCLVHRADEKEYMALYRDMQPGQNVYWDGFGKPPTLSFRADFDDMEFNRIRQQERRLIKGRFAGGNLGWIVPEDLELFAALYCKPLAELSVAQRRILELIDTLGPLNIQQIKEETGMLVKEITPALHRLQEAFVLYEDQYDGEWDRSWYRFGEMFPDAVLDRFTRREALKTVLLRFAYRMVCFDSAMAKSFYRLPGKEIKAALEELAAEGRLAACGKWFMLKEDAEGMESCQYEPCRSVYALHRNDILYKAYEPLLKENARSLTEGLEYDHEPLYYLLIDGEFHGAVVGHFRNGPYDLNDVVCDLPDAERRKGEILEAVAAVNDGRVPRRFMGEML